MFIYLFTKHRSVCMKKVDNISKAVTACCILHNIALKNDDYAWVPIDTTPDIPNADDGFSFMNLENITGVNKRNNIATL